MLVIINIVIILSKKEVVDVIKKVCRLSGGIYDSDVYILEVELCVMVGELCCE